MESFQFWFINVSVVNTGILYIKNYNLYVHENLNSVKYNMDK